MSTPFTYCITFLPTNQKYYGARWAHGCDPSDLWTTYFTSSSTVKSLIQEHGVSAFDISVRKTFSSVEECRSYEQRVLRMLNVTQNPRWINKNVNGKFLPTGPQTKDHISKRISKSINTRKQRGVFGKATWNKITNPEIAEAISLRFRGKSKSLDHIAKMKIRPQNTTSVVCPHCLKEGDLKNMKRWHFDKCKLVP